MTNGEALTIARIIIEADGGCAHCALGLADSMIYAFPEHRQVFVDVMLDRFDWLKGTWPEEVS